MIKKGFILKEIDGSFIVVAVGEASKNFNGVITLNETSAFIWNGLIKGQSAEEIAEEMSKIYDAKKDKLILDVNNFISKLTENGIIE